MKFKFALFYLTFLFYSSFHSQNETKNWYFGNSSGLSFTGTSVSTLTNGVLTSSLGCSSISDSTGNLLFYTDGVTVWNQSHTVMSNGTGLLGNSSAQSCIIAKKPGSTNLYYLFTVQGGGGSAGVNYSIVDMSLSAGQGSVTIKNFSLYAAACEEKITATKHCNGTDVWIVVLENTNFRSYLLSSSGIASAILSNYGHGNYPTLWGSMKLSPNGKKLGLVGSYSGSSGPGHVVELYDFNNSTGQISNYILLFNYNVNTNPIFYGCEFSPDGTKFYNTILGGIMQWELCNIQPNTPLLSTVVTEASENPTLDNTVMKGSMQLAKNGKIYIARPGKDSLAVINYPNLLGSSCMYYANGQSIGTATCGLGLPNFAGSFFEKRNPAFNYSTSPNACLSVSFTPPSLCSFSGYTVTARQWYFGDSSSGAANTSTLSNPTHLYSSVGNYTATLILYYGCNKSDTLIQSVLVTTPSVSILHPLLNCGLVSATVNTSGGIGPYSYTWSPSSQTTSVANNLTTGTYTVYMKDNGGGCGASATTTINSTFLSAGVFYTNTTCYAQANGSGSINVYGGSGNYSYTWTPGSQNTQSAGGLSAGVYTISAFDQTNLCPISTTLQITQPAPLAGTIVALSSSVCLGGKIILYAGNNGGTPSYSYLWGNTHTTISDTIQELNPGNYIYSVSSQDANNCSTTSTISLSFIPNPVLNAPVVSICKGNTGTMSVSGASSYTWMPGSLTVSSFTASPSITKIYTVTGSSLGCSSIINTTLNVLPVPIANPSSNSPLCAGQTLNLIAGANGLNYYWSGPNSFLSNLQNPNLSTSSSYQTGLYTLNISSVNSCSSAASISVTIYPAPTLSVSGNFTICEKEKTLLNVSGANTYTWNNAILNNTIVLYPTSTSVYTVAGANVSTGCSSIQTFTVMVSKCTGINSNDLNETSIKIYPNPCQEFLLVESEFQGKLALYSELGLLVFEKNIEIGENRIVLSSLANGFYSLRISSQNNTIIRSLIKLE